MPFVDPLTTILDPSLPLTVTEWDEWGNPLEDRDVYFYMKSYSPYENVEAKEYPAILAMTSLNDTRVFYVEPAKWVAALRHPKTDPQLRCCCAPRWRPGTAVSAAATSGGRKPRSSTHGCWRPPIRSGSDPRPTALTT